jgi:hypothetical protein
MKFKNPDKLTTQEDIEDIEEKQKYDKQSIFVQLGLLPEEGMKGEVYIDCPVCGSIKKMAVNATKKVFGCKKAICGFSGNESTVLSKFLPLLLSPSTGKRQNISRQLRKIKDDVFSEEYCPEIVWNELTDKYVWVSKNAKGEVIGGFHCGTRSKVVYSLGLLGEKAEMCGQLEMVTSGAPYVFVCEGFWDWHVMNYAIRFLGLESKYSTLCAPGANITHIKDKHILKDKHVILVMDNDEAGIKGNISVSNKYANVCKSVTFLQWGDDKKLKYDISDLFLDCDQDANVFFEYVLSHLTEKLIIKIEGKLLEEEIKEKITKGKNTIPPCSIADLHRKREEIFPSSNCDVIDVVYGAMISARFRFKAPCWLRVRSPPSTGKTTLLLPTLEIENTILMSAASAASLVSSRDRGAKAGPDDNVDNPLDFVNKVKRLDYAVVVNLDNSTVEAKGEEATNAFNSIMRGFYDSVYSAMSGSKETVVHENINFVYISACTNNIEKTTDADVGERYLTVSFSEDQISAREKITIEYDNANIYDTLLKEFTDCVVGTFNRHLRIDRPTMSREFNMYIGQLAVILAALRSVRGVREDGTYYSVPSIEGHYRIKHQLYALASGIMVYLEKTSLDDARVKYLLRKVVVDSIPTLRLKSLQDILLEKNNPIRYSSTGDIEERTWDRTIGELNAIGILKNKKIDTSTEIYRFIMDVDLFGPRVLSEHELTNHVHEE